MFGRAPAVQQLDAAFKRAGVPRGAIPDAVTLTAVRLLRESHGRAPSDAEADAAAALLSYCVLGRDPVLAGHGAEAVETLEQRLDRAVTEGDSLDARLVLLALHAGLLQESIRDRHGLTSADA